MIRLVVNADDLGLHPAIDEGIFRACQQGIVTSASVLATGRTAPSAVRAAANLGMGLGIHLCLSGGLAPAGPRAAVRSLAPDGYFRPSWREVALALVLGRVSLTEVESEFRDQLEMGKSLGASVDHIDSHQHIHLLPGIAQRVHKLAVEERLPLRIPREVPQSGAWAAPGPALKALATSGLAWAQLRTAPGLHAVGLIAAGALTEDVLCDLLRRLPEGDFELGCHPGKNPMVVPEDPNWKYGWDAELGALTSPKVKAIIAERNIVLCRYGDLFPKGTPGKRTPDIRSGQGKACA